MLPRSKFVPDLSPADILKYEKLCAQRRDISRRIRYMMDDAIMVERPIWGPCTRCGGTWKGKWPQRKPRCCAKCGSLYWDAEYSSPESKKMGEEMREQRRKMKERDDRFLTPKAPAKVNEVQAALEILHRHGLTAPSLPSNGRGLTPPPPPVVESVVPVVFTLPKREEPRQPERVPTHAQIQPEVPDVDESGVAEETITEPPEAETPRCCSRPLITEGICLNCGAGLERKVVTTDGHLD